MVTLDQRETVENLLMRDQEPRVRKEKKDILGCLGHLGFLARMDCLGAKGIVGNWATQDLMAIQEQRVKREPWALLSKDKRAKRDEKASRENLGRFDFYHWRVQMTQLWGHRETLE